MLVSPDGMVKRCLRFVRGSMEAPCKSRIATPSLGCDFRVRRENHENVDLGIHKVWYSSMQGVAGLPAGLTVVLRGLRSVEGGACS